MPRTSEPDAQAIRDLVLHVEGHRRQACEGPLSIMEGVKRQGRLVLRKPAAIGVFGVLFLQVSAVPQQNLAKVLRRRRTVNLAGEALPYKRWKIT